MAMNQTLSQGWKNQTQDYTPPPLPPFPIPLLTVITGGVGYDGVEHKEHEYHGQEEAKVAEIDKQDGQVLETTEIPTENGQTNSHVGHCMSRGERRVNT